MGKPGCCHTRICSSTAFHLLSSDNYAPWSWLNLAFTFISPGLSTACSLCLICPFLCLHYRSFSCFPLFPSLTVPHSSLAISRLFIFLLIFLSFSLSIYLSLVRFSSALHTPLTVSLSHSSCNPSSCYFLSLITYISVLSLFSHEMTSARENSLFIIDWLSSWIGRNENH